VDLVKIFYGCVVFLYSLCQIRASPSRVYTRVTELSGKQQPPHFTSTKEPFCFNTHFGLNHTGLFCCFAFFRALAVKEFQRPDNLFSA